MKDKVKPGKSSKSDMVLLPQEDLWQSLYALMRHWKSDLEFMEDELNFFRLLIDKHLSLLIDEKNIAQTRTMVSHVNGAEKDRSSLLRKIESHSEHIAAWAENPFLKKAQEYKSEHDKLATEFACFVKAFRDAKSEVFKLTEKVIHSEKAQKLIGQL